MGAAACCGTGGLAGLGGGGRAGTRLAGFFWAAWEPIDVGPEIGGIFGVGWGLVLVLSGLGEVNPFELGVLDKSDLEGLRSRLGGGGGGLEGAGTVTGGCEGGGGDRGVCAEADAGVGCDFFGAGTAGAEGGAGAALGFS